MALYQCLKGPFLAAVIPRLFLLGFRYSQPILIKESIRYVASGPTIAASGRGAGLIVSAVAIYGGLAVALPHLVKHPPELISLSRSRPPYTETESTD